MRVEMKQRGWKLDSFKELVEKAVNVEAKAALRPCSYVCETDQYCLQESWLSTTKANTKGQPMKDLRVKEPKSRPQEAKTPASQHSSNNIKTSEQARKEKKKKNKRHWGQKP